jgi:hypothetical protein
MQRKSRRGLFVEKVQKHRKSSGLRSGMYQLFGKEWTGNGDGEGKGLEPSLGIAYPDQEIQGRGMDDSRQSLWIENV